MLPIPEESRCLPVEVVGSCILPFVFAPVDHVFKATVRVVVDLSDAIVLGTAFLKEHPGTISFE